MLRALVGAAAVIMVWAFTLANGLAGWTRNVRTFTFPAAKKLRFVS